MQAGTWNAYTAPGAWYKGNLHCHSTNSDGERSAEDVVAFYQSHGYQILALSDHRTVTDISSYASPTFLPLGAMEIDGHHAVTNGPFHMQAIGLHQLRGQPQGMALPDLLAEIARDGGVTIFNHPYWLGTCATDLQALEGCLGIEVYNAGCEVEVAKGYSMQCWDDALQRGKRFFGFATDDAHWKIADHGLGWVMVKAPRLDETAILEAFRQGHFYSTSGPDIHYLGIEDGVAQVRCSPVDAVHFLGQKGRGERIAAPPGEKITGATYWLTGKEQYLRVECVQKDGPRAWSNPIWLS